MSLNYQLDAPKSSYEFGFSTGNELFCRLVHKVSSFVSLAAELYSKHYPAPKTDSSLKQPKGITHSRVNLAVRFSNVDRSNALIGDSLAIPYEITTLASLGHHYGVSGCIKPWGGRLALALSWKRRWFSPEQKAALGVRFNYTFDDIPMVFKLTLSTHDGIASFIGCRLSEIGIGFGLSANPNTSRAQASLFFDV